LRTIRIAVMLLVLLSGLTLSFTQTEASGDVSTYIFNGEKQHFNNQGIIKSGTTLVPLRVIFEALDADVKWNQKDKTIHASKGNTKVWLKIGSRTAKVNEKAITISVPAQIKDNQTLVPLRFISQSLGEKVSWNNSTKTVMIGNAEAGADPWLGQYYNPWYTGSGMMTDLYVYEKTPDTISFVSQTGFRYDPTGGDLYGYQMPWEFNDFYGKAYLLSDDSASFTSGSCKAILQLDGGNIRVNQVSSAGSCDLTGLGMYDNDEYSAYQKF
jgi:hypothetical protein